MTKKDFRRKQFIKIGEMVDEELALSNEIHPSAFVSPMEGLGIIEEEHCEVAQELAQMNKFYKDFKFYLREGVSPATTSTVLKMKVQAIKACQELLQVAAMCQKFEDSGVMW